MDPNINCNNIVASFSGSSGSSGIDGVEQISGDNPAPVVGMTKASVIIGAK